MREKCFASFILGNPSDASMIAIPSFLAVYSISLLSPKPYFRKSTLFYKTLQPRNITIPMITQRLSNDRSLVIWTSSGTTKGSLSRSISPPRNAKQPITGINHGKPCNSGSGTAVSRDIVIIVVNLGGRLSLLMYLNHRHLTPTSPHLIVISPKSCEPSPHRFSVSLRPTAGSPGLSLYTLTHR